MPNKRTAYIDSKPAFKVITFEPQIEEDSIRAQHEIEALVQQGWSLVRATTTESGSPSVVLLERL